MKTILAGSLAAMCLALSACGGSEGGGGVASTPAPIPAPAPSPTPAPTPSPSPTPPPVTITSSKVTLTPLINRAGLTAGTYQPIAIAYQRAKGSGETDIIGGQTTRFLDPAVIKLSANPAANSYTLEMSVAGFPGLKVLDVSKTVNESGQIVDSHFGNRVPQTDTYSDGTTKVTQYDAEKANVVKPFKDISSTAATRDYYGVDLGLRYVSFGYWSQEDVERLGPVYRMGTFYGKRLVGFAFGRRTAAGELPVSGTATYQGKVSPLGADYFTGPYFEAFDLKLTAKFAGRSIDALIDAKAQAGDGWDLPDVTGLSISGTGAIGNDGGYSIALSGNTIDPWDANSNEPLTGSLLGAFFGPGAEETGGVFKIDYNAAPLLYGTYGLTRTGP